MRILLDSGDRPSSVFVRVLSTIFCCSPPIISVKNLYKYKYILFEQKNISFINVQRFSCSWSHLCIHIILLSRVHNFFAQIFCIVAAQNPSTPVTNIGYLSAPGASRTWPRITKSICCSSRTNVASFSVLPSYFS